MIAAEGGSRLEIAAIGDVGLIGTARIRARREGWEAPFAAFLPGFAGRHAVFANLEFPVGEPGLVRPGRSSEFWHDRGVCGGLARAGVGIVSLANNHMLDCGPEGLARTLDACREAGLAAVGAGMNLESARRPVERTIGGRSTVWLAYSAASGDAAGPGRPGVCPLEPGLVREDLAHWRTRADLLIVSAHWGSMYVDFPPPRVLELAEVMAECGADVVLGHHPHVLQGAERRGRTLVLYSLGDAAFNCRAGDFHAQVAAERRLESGVFQVTCAEAHGVHLLPLRLDADGFPHDAGTETERQAARWESLSAGLAEAAERFHATSAPTLLRYELESLATHLRHGRWDRVIGLLSSLRPRHIPVLWSALRRMGRRA